MIDDILLKTERHDGDIYHIHGNFITSDHAGHDKVGGDYFDVGDMKNVTGVSIGRKAKASS